MKKLHSFKKEHMFDKSTSWAKIAVIFFKYPYKEFTLSEVATEAGVSKSMASAIISDMMEEGIVRLEKLGKKLWRIRANSDNPSFRRWKIVSNLNMVYTSGIIEILNSMTEVFGVPKAIILFGSFRWGEDSENSDIDIAVETSRNPIIFDKTDKCWAVMGLDDLEGPFNKDVSSLKKLEKEISRKIKIMPFRRKDIDNGVFNNIANGIVLNGFLVVGK